MENEFGKRMGQTLLVTGGAGFIGSNFIRYVLQREPDVRIVNLDALTYAGNLENLRDIADSDRYIFVHGRIQDQPLVRDICQKYDVRGIVNFAAETHVDRSIHDSWPFIETNIAGVVALLEVVRELGIARFVHISTDEVYGSISSGYFTENDQLQPSSPYASSKASADLLILSYVRTYGIPAIITRSSNNYGPYQFPEKFIPLMITNALEDKPLPIYGDGQNVRDWLHVQDHCAAVWEIYHRGKIGEIYNISANQEYRNIEVAELILKILGKPQTLIRFVPDRPGHDRRYAIDATKLRRELGWEPKVTFEDGLYRTVQWYVENAQWWKNIKSGAYQEYYQKQYKYLEESNE